MSLVTLDTLIFGTLSTFNEYIINIAKALKFFQLLLLRNKFINLSQLSISLDSYGLTKMLYVPYL